jgi:uncharacterized protein YjbI with pentapeptide repeats
VPISARPRLRNAKFERARLQSAHLDGALLERSNFQGADLSDAYFRELGSIDFASMQSLSRANWQDAHFDANVRAGIERLSRNGGRPLSGAGRSGP